MSRMNFTGRDDAESGGEGKQKAPSSFHRKGPAVLI